MREWERYQPEQVDDIETIDDYIDAVKATLRYWLDCHTKGVYWGIQWLGSQEPLEAMESECGVAENTYFTFKWKATASGVWFTKNSNMFTRCNKCGCIFDRGHEDDGCCENKGKKFVRLTKAQALEWAEDAGVSPDITNEDAWNVLITEGFKVYRAALQPLTKGIEAEIKNALEALKKAKTPLDLIEWIAWAGHIMHVHGNVLQDYGTHVGLYYHIVNEIQQDGLAAFFGQDVVDAYMNGNLIERAA